MEFGDSDDITGGSSDGGDVDGNDTAETSSATEEMSGGAHDISATSAADGEGGGIENTASAIDSIAGSSLEMGKIDGAVEDVTVAGAETPHPFDTVTQRSVNEMSANAKEIAFSFAKERAPERSVELDSKARELSAPTLERYANPNILGTHELGTDRISISDLATNRAADHVLVHEYTHASSFQKSSSLETSETKMSVERSGILSVVKEMNKASGEMTIKDYHRAANEGITESRALMAEKAAGREASLASYSTNRTYMSQLEKIVGNNTIDNAYYNGDVKGISDRMDALSLSPNAWSRFSCNLDVVCSPYSTEAERSAAKTALDDAIREMAERKAEVEQAGR